MNASRSRSRVVIALALLAATLMPAAVFAQSTYIGANFGNWATGTNWSAGSIPSITTDAVVSASSGTTSQVRINATTSATANALSIGGAGISQVALRNDNLNSLTVATNITLGTGSGASTLLLGVGTGFNSTLTINSGNGSILRGAGSGATDIQIFGNMGTLGLRNVTVDVLQGGNSSGSLTIGSNQLWTVNDTRIGLNAANATNALTIANTGTLNSGTVKVGNAAANGTNTATLNLETGGVILATTISRPASQTAVFNWNGGTIQNKSSGDLTVTGGAGGTLTISLADAATGTPTFSADSGRTITVTSTATLADKAGMQGTITKAGLGTLTFDGTHSYSGATVIRAGTLKLNASGSFANSSTITVGDAGSSGAVLDLTAKTGTFAFGSSQTVKGIGTLNIGTGKTVSSAGIWAPGNSIGSNAVTGNLALSGTSQFELGTPGTSTANPGTSDFTAVSGTLTLGGDLTLLDNAGANGNGSAAGGVYRLFTYGNAVSGSYASVTTSPTATTRTSLSNISLGGSGTGSGQGVFLSVYNLAAGSVASGTSINFGTVLKNTPLSQSLSITNTAPTNAYSEKLGTAFGAATGLASGSGSWSLLSAGGTSTALSVYLASGSAGAASGSQSLNYTSDGAGSSGLSAVGAGSQTVNLSATILDPAVASFGSGPSAATSLTLDFLTVNEGDIVSPQNFSLYNLLQTAGYTADLALLSITPGGGNSAALTTNLATFSSLASGSFSSWQASVNTANQGTFSNTWTLQFKSSNGGTVYSGDTAQTLTLTANVIIVPEPGALALAAAGIGLAAVGWVRRRRS